MSRSEPNTWKFGTRLVHTGAHEPAPKSIPTTPPIYTSATYLYGSADQLDRAFDDNELVYSRFGNPTVGSFEANITAAENGRGAIAFASGMAALHAAVLAAGTPRGSMQPAMSRILGARDMYGSTASLLRDFFGAQGIAVDFCDMSDLAAVAAQMRAAPPDVVVIEPSVESAAEDRRCWRYRRSCPRIRCAVGRGQHPADPDVAAPDRAWRGSGGA